MRVHYIVISLILLVLTSCSKESNECDQLENKNISIQSEDLTNKLINIDSKADAFSFIENYPSEVNYFFNSTRQLNDTAIADQMIDIFTHPSYKDTLYVEVENTFGDFNGLNNEFSSAFTQYKSIYPEIKVPRITYLLSGLQKDLFISDTSIQVAVDYFLGPDARYVPLGLPQYILRRYQKEYIVPMSMLLLTQKHNRTDPENNTLLADMIYYGKSYYLAKQIMPCTPDSLLIGYTAKEMSDINKNEHIIWANFLENDLLYETSHFMKNKFIGERPTTFEIGDNCPGRIGLWVGWQIVKSYMENNPQVSTKDLMDNIDVNLIFAKSKYKPKG